VLSKPPTKPWFITPKPQLRANKPDARSALGTRQPLSSPTPPGAGKACLQVAKQRYRQATGPPVAVAGADLNADPAALIGADRGHQPLDGLTYRIIDALVFAAELRTTNCETILVAWRGLRGCSTTLS
jgi:hypothetical protein